MLYELVSGSDGAHGAYIHGVAATRAISKSEQKALGQYMTPPGIARFMAQSAVQGLGVESVRVLEPAAGSGVLAAAAVEALLASAAPPTRIELLLYEIDARLTAALRHVCEALKEKCERLHVQLDYLIRTEDFLLSSFAREQRSKVDLVIGNPPYFKLPKQDERVVAHAYAVWGQPNIYGLFMAACAGLLRQGGRLCFITPRSWMSGSYFSAVRRHLLARIQLDRLHTFDSRSEHFSEDSILQEAVITWGTARAQGAHVVVSSSRGAEDLSEALVRRLSSAQVVGASGDCVVRLPARDTEPPAWPAFGFAEHGLRVSTGPVIAFRAARFLRDAPGAQAVPLLWLQHVRAMAVSWPIRKKREHIVVCAGNAWMLLPNEPMVVLRRFSPKEDHRRVTAAPYLGELPGEFIGLENHLNYVCRPGGCMSTGEVVGLAAFLNSRQVNEHFESISGHTQVNATDLRALALPSVSQLERLGALVSRGSSLDNVDEAVAAVLAMPMQESPVDSAHA